MDIKERRFEEDIESYMLTLGGYTKGDLKTYDRAEEEKVNKKTGKKSISQKLIFPRYHQLDVVTDRTVLDGQLQKNIYSFDHTEGVVEKIDEEKH